MLSARPFLIFYACVSNSFYNFGKKVRGERYNERALLFRIIKDLYEFNRDVQKFEKKVRLEFQLFLLNKN